MLIDDVIDWYEKNVNYKLTKSFINFLIKTGIIKKDLTLEEINLFLLERYGDDFVKENGLFRLKENRVGVIKKFPDNVEIKDKQKPKEEINLKEIVKISKKPPEQVKKHKFKIESLGGKKLKLIKT